MDAHLTLRTFTGAVAAFAIIFGYFASPLLPFAHAAPLAVGGMAFAAGVSASWLALRMGWGRRWEWPFTAVGVLGLMVIAWQVNVAIVSYDAIDRTCLVLEKDMMSAAPARNDGPALFEALRCRPSGEFPLHLNRGAVGQLEARSGARPPLI